MARPTITNKRMIYIADTNETTVVNIGQIIEAIMYENDGILMILLIIYNIIILE